MKNKLKNIIDHYGILPQLKYFQTEVFELNEAIIKAENKYEPIQDIEHIAEEIADNFVLLFQFMEHYGITHNQIKEIMKFKIDRQISRIEKEKEKNDKMD